MAYFFAAAAVCAILFVGIGLINGSQNPQTFPFHKRVTMQEQMEHKQYNALMQQKKELQDLMNNKKE